MKFKIDKKDILQIASTSDIYRRGARYYEENRISEIKYEKTRDEIIVISTIDGNYREYIAKIRFDKSGVLLSHTCNCQAHVVWKGACKHIIAALLKVHDDSLSYCKDAQNNDKAQKIISGFENEIFSNINKRLETVKTDFGSILLEPLIKINQKNQLSLSLLIGRDRLYVVKNIEEFARNILEEKSYSYGKDFKIHHYLNMFDFKSRNLASLVIEYFKSLDSKCVCLSGSFADKFFELYKNSSLSIDIDGISNKSLPFLEGYPEIKINIAIDENKKTASIAECDYSYHITNGNEYSYIFTEKGIYKLENHLANALITLLNELHGQKGGIVFKDKAYFGFMEYIYPKMALFGAIDSFEEKKELPKLYFDMPKNEIEAKIIYPEDFVSNVYYKNPLIYAIEEYFKIWDFTKDPITNKYVLFGNDNIYNFLSSDFEEIKKICEIFISDEYKKKDINASLKVSVGLKLNGDLLNVSLDTGNYSFHQLLNALESLEIKKKYFRFKDGSFIDINNKDLNTFKDLSNELDIKASTKDNDFEIPKYKSIFLNDILSSNGALLSTDNNFDSFIDSFRNSKDLKFSVPSHLKDVLRPYQVVGFEWLKALVHLGFGAILADEMGLGKTIQMIALILSEKLEGKGPTLVVCPTSLIYNWQKEFVKFAPSLKSIVVNGSALDRLKLIEDEKDVDVFIITYDTLKRDINNFIETKFNIIVLDEAQYIKNPATKASSIVKKLNANYRFALTGTPIENSLSELWSIFDFILPGYLYGYLKFQKIYEKPIVKDNDEDSLFTLRRQIAPFILRRTKKEVLRELPDKVYTTLYAELTKEQKKLYIANFLKAKGELDAFVTDGAFDKNRFKVLSQLTRLRQICCHPKLFVENYDHGSGKLDITIDTIKSVISSNHRILLFSQFTSMLEIIKESLDKLDISYFYLDGSTPAKKRSELTDAFNKGGADVFLISLKAGGSGLNLTGADVIIHFDQWWNPAVMEQASDRAHRIGQKNTVQVFNIIAKDTLEEKIIELQDKKKDLINNVMINGASFINRMDEKEIIALFQTD